VWAADLAFAWITDTHIVTTDTVSTPGAPTLRLQTALRQINARPELQFLVHSGDTVETPLPEQFAAFLAVMKPSIPWYPVAGNHDIGNVSTSASLSRWLGLGLGRGDEEREYYGFVRDGAAFFALNGFPGNPKTPAMKEHTEEQLRAMDAFFASHADAPFKAVLAHPPLFIRSMDEKDEYFNVHQPLRGRLAQIMQKHGVRDWLSGHRHLMDKVTDAATGVTVWSQPSLAFAIGKGSRMGFCVFRVRGGTLEREFVEVK
jgi:3',5'-cyclic AMP phosphodiesterase CpdA